jgi:hypothetical protein
MAWYAKIQNNIVIEVTYVVDNLDSDWLYREYGGTWLKCTEDGSLRNVFPSAGFTYNNEEDIFYPPKPFPSWIFDINKKQWVAPVDFPQDGARYLWDEEIKQWVVT